MGYDRGDSFPFDFSFPFQMEVHLVQNRKENHGDSFPIDFFNQIDFHLVQNWEENCHHDHIPFNLKGNGILVFSVYLMNTKPKFSDADFKFFFSVALQMRKGTFTLRLFGA